jgi:hypothetical protein
VAVCWMVLLLAGCQAVEDWRTRALTPVVAQVLNAAARGDTAALRARVPDAELRGRLLQGARGEPELVAAAVRGLRPRHSSARDSTVIVDYAFRYAGEPRTLGVLFRRRGTEWVVAAVHVGPI